MEKHELKDEEFKKKFGYDSIVFDVQEPWEPAIAKKNGKAFHIDSTTGKQLYKKKFDWIGHFNNGSAIVRKNHEWFDIGKDGKIIPPKN